MGPKKKTTGSQRPKTDKGHIFDQVILYLPDTNERDAAGLRMFELFTWKEITKHPSYPSLPARILRDRKVDDDDRLRRYTIPFFVGTKKLDVPAYIFATVERGSIK